MLFGFPRSVYVQMAGIVLTHKEVPYTFHDLETEMNTAGHLALHPFERVPILRHGDFTLYETSAIVAYVDDAFEGPKLTPADPRTRALMNQWISAINGYYYPYLIYHVSHERNVFPQLGIESDEKVVAHAMPKVETCLEVLERQLARSGGFLFGPKLGLADYFMLPIIDAFGFSPEAQERYPQLPAISTWRERMEASPTIKRFRAAQPPRGPILHARRWVDTYRPTYCRVGEQQAPRQRPASALPFYARVSMRTEGVQMSDEISHCHVPTGINGMLVSLIVSHYENNYGGAVKRLNAIAAQLAELDFADGTGFRRQRAEARGMIATNSTILDELFFASLGGRCTRRGVARPSFEISAASPVGAPSSRPLAGRSAAARAGWC